jgi:hypothetical protein
MEEYYREYNNHGNFEYIAKCFVCDHVLDYFECQAYPILMACKHKVKKCIKENHRFRYHKHKIYNKLNGKVEILCEKCIPLLIYIDEPLQASKDKVYFGPVCKLILLKYVVNEDSRYKKRCYDGVDKYIYPDINGIIYKYL